jgi:hypothetical protein
VLPALFVHAVLLHVVIWLVLLGGLSLVEFFRPRIGLGLYIMMDLAIEVDFRMNTLPFVFLLPNIVL